MKSTELPRTEESTGLPSLDRVLGGVLPGDNIVWQVDTLDDYRVFVRPYVKEALRRGKRVNYFRFSRQKEVVPRDIRGVATHELDPKVGFENFIIEIRRIIERNGEGAYYVFDSHTELAGEAYSDRLLGNFFLLTCPYLFELKTVTYFGVLRRYHSYHAAAPMVVTTQVLIDVYRDRNHLFIHPLKVEGRFSPTMFMLHSWEGDDFVPVKKSVVISDILTAAPWPGLQSASYRQLGQWDRWFMQAEEVLEEYGRGECAKKLVDASFHHLLPPLISEDRRILDLARKYLTLEDLINIWKRMIGSGRLGGKSVGLLLARAILRKRKPRWKHLLESHDSFFIGSDVFYTYLIMNGCWVIRQRQRHSDTYLTDLEEVQRRIRAGQFPDYILHRFSDMLDYFGQSPIIVRSSSLLEDAFGNAFAGKYESVFCPNQGPHDKRLGQFLDAVKTVYATAMGAEALHYRAKRGMLESDEQMSLLVQRVSGEPHGRYFFPHLAGVAFSFNPYVWNEGIDPEAGMMRLVAGLGTRAVDRADDDYTRVVALNAPDKRPEASFHEVKRYAQRRLDVIDLEDNAFTSAHFIDVVKQAPQFPAGKFATVDEELDYSRSGREQPVKPWVLTLDPVIESTTLVADIREMIDTLRHAYGKNVDVEFTANLGDDGTYRINLLQCRPLQVKEGLALGNVPTPPMERRSVVLEAHGGVVGRGRVIAVDRIIQVVPARYSALNENDRYAVARLIGRLTHLETTGDHQIMLIGPGRWGTRMPSLGVPVSFNEINTVSVLCEINTMHEGLVPDLSLGTHFFNEMVEMDMLYLAIFSTRGENRFHEKLLRTQPNRLPDLCPEEKTWSETVRVVDAEDLPGGRGFYLNADALKQAAYLYTAPRVR